MPATLVAALIALALLPTAAFAQAGTLDRGFGDNGRVVTQSALGGADWLNAHVQVAEGPGGTIVAAVGDTAFRYLPNGALDPDFGEGGKQTIADPEGLPFTVHDLAVDPGGRLWLIGEVNDPDVQVPINYLGTMIHPPVAAVIRYTATGKLDPSFGGGKGFLLTDLGQSSSPYGSVAPYQRPLTGLMAGAIDPDGGLVAIGLVYAFPQCSIGHSSLTSYAKLVVRITPDGLLDPEFGASAGIPAAASFENIDDIALDGADPIAIGQRTAQTCNDVPSYGLVRMNAAGNVDVGFGHSGGMGVPAGPPSQLTVDGNQRILILTGRGILRLTPGGKLDRRFGYRGRADVKLPGGSALGAIMSMQSGDVLLAGTQAVARDAGSASGYPSRYHRSFTVVRLDSLGHPDRRFGHHGWVATHFGAHSGVLGQEGFVDREGRLVIAGPIARPDLEPTGGIALARYLGGR